MSPALLVAVALLIPGVSADTFEIQAELQGLYDEISQATLQVTTGASMPWKPCCTALSRLEDDTAGGKE